MTRSGRARLGNEAASWNRIAQYLPHYFHTTVEERFRRRGLRDNQAFEAAILEHAQIGFRLDELVEDVLQNVLGVARVGPDGSEGGYGRMLLGGTVKLHRALRPQLQQLLERRPTGEQVLHWFREAAQPGLPAMVNFEGESILGLQTLLKKLPGI